MSARRILIVDDHDGFRASAAQLLTLQGCDVVGSAADAEEALEAVERLAPDLVLLDVQLPGIDGVEVAERLATRTRPPAVILISSREAAAYEPRVVAAPVRGFLAKRDLAASAIDAMVR